MRIRPLHRDDRDALLRIWNDGAEFDPLTPTLLEEKIWGDKDFDQTLCAAADLGEGVAAFAVGVVRDPGAGFIKLLAVDRQHRRQGIGRTLLEGIEAALAGAGAKSIRLLESAPNYLSPGIDIRYAAALQFAAECGYEQVGKAMNLSVELEEALRLLRDTPTADGIEIRRAQVRDEGPLCAFLADHWPTWIPEAMSALGNAVPTLHLAVRDRAVVGFAASDANNKGTGWFGPMGVSPNERQSGTGRALLKSCLVDISEQGHARATIPWVDSVPFYEKCAGATLSRSFGRFEKKRAQLRANLHFFAGSP